MEHAGHQGDAGAGVDTDHPGNTDRTDHGGSVSIMCRRDGPTGVVVLTGDLDLAGGDAVEAAVAGLVAEGVDDVSVQAQGVTFMDSSGLGGLLAARAIVVDAEGTFRFGPAADNVARVIELAGVGDLLDPTGNHASST